jgi:hypothetical protein
LHLTFAVQHDKEVGLPLLRSCIGAHAA